MPSRRNGICLIFTRQFLQFNFQPTILVVREWTKLLVQFNDNEFNRR